MEFTTKGGLKLYVGRINTQNDYLTFKIASKDDIWFHVKDFPGSHVILVTDGKEPRDEDYTEAAAVAAYYSKSRADVVGVDYTRVKNIKKPTGSKPGYVIYKTNYTAFVKPYCPEKENNNG
jgi:predicted ribosome quality control (RQC) complex YloA/Tae2 family protein